MPTPQQMQKSIVILSCSGLLIGGILYGILLLHALPLVLLSSVILVLWIWLTLVVCIWMGLADTADAWIGGFGDKHPEMKDPSCGPIGVLSLIMVCILKWSALYVLLQQQCYSALIYFLSWDVSYRYSSFKAQTILRDKGLGSQLTNI